MPLNTTGRMVYSFQGIQWVRSNYNLGNDDWMPWSAISSKEPMMGGAAPFRDSTGAIDTQFQMEATFADRATRDNLRSKRGVTATLTKSFNGVVRETGTYTLKDCTPITNMPGIAAAKITFE